MLIVPHIWAISVIQKLSAVPIASCEVLVLAYYLQKGQTDSGITVEIFTKGDRRNSITVETSLIPNETTDQEPPTEAAEESYSPRVIW